MDTNHGSNSQTELCFPVRAEPGGSDPSGPQPLNPLEFAVGAAISAVVLVIGLLAAAPFGRGAPILERVGRREPWFPSYGRALAFATLAGVLLGAILLILLLVLISVEPKLSARLASRVDQPAWMPWALAFASSILEEFVFRLFLMSGTVWLITKLARAPAAQPSAAVVRIALGVSTVGFALAHLPAWLASVSPTPFLIVAVLLLNGLAGLLTGQVYWRWGIEAAILCHFAGDMVIQSIGPRLIGA